MLKFKTLFGFFWMSTNSIFITALQLLKLIILVRLLDPSDFGQMAILTVIIAFTGSISDLGIGTAIVQQLKLTRNQFSSLYWVNIITAVIIFTLIILLSGVIANFYLIPDLNIKLIFLASTILIRSLGYQYSFLLQKHLEFKNIALVGMLSECFAFLATVSLAYLGYGIWSLIIGQIILSLVYSFLMLYFGVKLFYLPRLYFQFSEIKKLLSFGFFQAGERLVNFTSANIDKLLISKIIGVDALGYYSIIFQIVMLPVSKINPMMNTVLYPIYSKLRSNRQEREKAYLLSMRFLSAVTVPLMLYAHMYSFELISVFLGEKWISSQELFQVLIFVALSKTLANPGGALLLSIGRSDIGFWWNIFWAFISWPIIIIALQIYPNVMSVAYSWLFISYSIGILWYVIIARIVGINFLKYVIFLIRLICVSLILSHVIFNFLEFIEIENLSLILFSSFVLFISLYLSYIVKFEKHIMSYFFDRIHK
jgi:O-antigen/teichoic acid export membrane protein